MRVGGITILLFLLWRPATTADAWSWLLLSPRLRSSSSSSPAAARGSTTRAQLQSRGGRRPPADCGGRFRASISSDDEDEQSPPAADLLPGGGIETLLSWFLPPAVAASAFATYQDTRTAFHGFIDAASGHAWVAVDGGRFMADMVRPVLNGPVTLSISILFGTLVATTVSTLYGRQVNLRKTVIRAEEQVRHITLLVLDSFPEEPPYRGKAKKLLRQFVTKVLDDFKSNSVTEETLSGSEMDALLLLLNRLSREEPGVRPQGPVAGEVYAGIGQMVALRSDFRSNFQTVFSPAHYANMVALASTILFVFLLETDQDAMQYLLGFQLSICWSLLVGTYSLLAVVIYDLSTPFAGTFSILGGGINNNNNRNSSNNQNSGIENLWRDYLLDMDDDKL
jgi:hypothetical protein